MKRNKVLGTLAFAVTILTACSGNSKRASAIFEIPVIVSGPGPSCQVVETFNDSHHKYKDKLLYILPTSEGYTIICEQRLQERDSNAVYDFVTKELNSAGMTRGQTK
jgi:hypothetical protein